MEEYLQRLEPVLFVLLRAYDYARDLKRPPEEFAVLLRTLRDHGADRTDMQWLLEKGYLREVNRKAGATACTSGNIRPQHRSGRRMFVLTDSGVDVARCVVGGQAKTSIGLGANGKPVWRPRRHELYFNGRLVKKFKQPAPNQELILAAFQEEEWPRHIYDPLPPAVEIVSAERLRAAVKRLNRHQHQPLVRFECDGRGEGVIWSPCD